MYPQSRVKDSCSGFCTRDSSSQAVFSDIICTVFSDRLRGHALILGLGKSKLRPALIW